MPKLPGPPPADALAGFDPDVRVVPAHTVVWRLFFAGGDHPTTWDAFRAWGPTTSRFDHHLPPPRAQERAILYAAAGPRALTTTLAEVFQETRVVERRPRAPVLSSWALRRDVRLLDLTRTWPTRAGASMALSTGRHDRARAWSMAIYEAFPDLDGLYYPSSMHAHEPCIALYERARDAVPARPLLHRHLTDPVMRTILKNACRAIGYKFA